MKKIIILTIIICLLFTACDKNVINPVENNTIADIYETIETTQLISIKSNYEAEKNDLVTLIESDYDIESDNWFEITYSDTDIWNDYMPSPEWEPNDFSNCKCSIEISLSYHNIQSIYISAFLTANSLGKNPVDVHSGNISYSDFNGGVFKYEFRPEKYRLADGEEYKMKIIVQIDDNEQTIINTGIVEITS